MITEWNETTEQGITYPQGFRASGVRCGLKIEGKDLALLIADSPAVAAGVFTTNQVKASCVTWSQQVTRRGTARAIVCNAGNANACNGEQGDRDNARIAEIAAQQFGCAAEEVVVASTGVIGHLLPVERLEDGVPRAATRLGRSPEHDADVSRAIMTTDIRPKLVAVSCRSDAWEGALRFGGVCKGSGMIAPNMATMLCFLTTDVRISARLLQQALSRAVERTFNRVTVDGDTSTNDMCIALASGMGEYEVREHRAALADFTEALERVCRKLAREVARDGEGATKLVEVAVKGAGTEAGAAQIAKTIAESPLVKTALFGCDPNWGRILAAAGRAGVAFDPGQAYVALGGIPVFDRGRGLPFDAAAANCYLRQEEVSLLVDLRQGSEAAIAWTCDFSYDYVRINAEYHT